ncbi:MAG: 4Fe-4S binding protein, partial [Candidatus Heimdallarchaeota archaeon]
MTQKVKLKVVEKEDTKKIDDEDSNGFRYDLLSIKPINWLARRRWYPHAIIAVNFVVFMLVIAAGFFGTTVGNANISIILVWIVWWSALIMFLVPVMGRYWCTICPIPMLGEWFQRGQPISKTPGKSKLRGLNKRWPKKFRNMWPATLGFLTVAIFSGLLTTIPLATAIMLSLLIIVAVITSYVFQKRTFCRYLCPIGGFIGLYSQSAPLELRVKDPDVCACHRPKDCVIGNDLGFACPWMEYPGKMDKNTYCGLCMECFKVCPQDNIALNVRPFGADLVKPAGKMDEAFKANVMLGAAMLYSVVLLGPYGDFKALANFDTILGAIKYGAFFFAVLLGVIPAYFYSFAWINSKVVTSKNISPKEIFKNFAYTTVPLGLMTWIGFSLLVIISNWVYIVNVINDPFGWGWQLLGIDSLKWNPVITGIIPYLIIAIIMIGFWWSIKLVSSISRELFPV